MSLEYMTLSIFFCKIYDKINIIIIIIIIILRTDKSDKTVTETKVTSAL